MVVEGLDASGKTTQAQRLRDHLEARGCAVYARFHPESDNWAGIRARRFLLADGWSAHFAAAMFYIADVLRSVIITPWRAYDYVIYVRYLMGTIYLPPPIGVFAYRFFTTILPRSKHVFYLDIKPEEAYSRIVRGRSQIEMFESKEQLEKIGSRAFALASSSRWIIINGAGTEEDVWERILAKLKSNL
ncbi:MAG: thymidylate kinase [Candidatus Bathyarchaeota archaeon]|nr:thymidylate kinase [Candidatus Bathyarchaeota archaeon]MDP7207641.1 thymidylate kinase [Candidatus Bathyarchaeota archaeon]MDP7443389.1 thymidylate kinase [Candidatus Bathyarchaeota archaeon]